VVGEQVGGGSFDGDPTLAEYVAVVGDRQGPCGVLFDEDDGEFGPVTQVTQQCEDLFGDQGRQSERGFVEEQYPGASHERASDGEHLTFTAGEGARGLIEPFDQGREELQDLSHGLVVVAATPDTTESEVDRKSTRLNSSHASISNA